jgi:hypothetical protein
MGHSAIAHVERDVYLSGMGLGHGPDEVGIGERGGANHNPRDALGQRFGDGL